ncbi:MAG: hypothetical protein JSS63_03800 [Bacteroidetes bacterium]|nr:hypothetical protein [Bacteroidota bacterium]
MEIRKDLIQKYLHEIAIEQLKETYTKKGYMVSTDMKFGNYTADIVVQNIDEMIVFEVNTTKMNDLQKEKFYKLSEEVKKIKNCKFKVIIAKPPKEKLLEVYGLENVLDVFLIDIEDISAISSLCHHYTIDEVADIELESLIIENNEIKVTGSTSLGIYLFYSQEKEDEGLYDRIYLPMTFDMILNLVGGELKMQEMISWSIDTSSL